MILFPAIDLLNGKCVRLIQGDYDQETVYSDSPVNMAKTWKKKGANYLHIVDLDAARTNEAVNQSIIQSIAKEVKIPIQVGGGIRSMERIESYISAGVKRVIIGTAAIKDPAFLKEAVDQYGEKIAVSIDARNGYVATEGWEKTSEVAATDLLKKLENIGVQTVIYTDIAKDGMLQGPNFEELREMNERSPIQMIASGGVSSPADVVKLQAMNMYGAIIGKALYDGTVSFESLLEVVRHAEKD
ncbi:MAG TPA: 1-(5-phosphoribosyl)-5-[(5-phosphoribosylamino)methylideneamino]imidazole-4-carboxamide isomerase [Bacillota bacterium]